jgi:hypothetical protein
MADVTLTTVDAFMKELYSGDKPMNVATQNKPLLEWIPKKDGFVGDLLVVPLSYANGAGRAGVFADAQANAAGGKHVKWQLTRAHDYAVLTIDAETMKASKNNIGAFVEARKVEVDGMLDELGRSAALSLYRTKYGVLGRRASLAGDIVTLETAADARNFYVGMHVEAMTDEVATALRVGSTTVAGVDRNAGTVTLTSAAAIAAFANNDYLIQKGDADTGVGNKFSGLAEWLPLSAPGATTFFGVNRSVDTVRLGGERLDNTAGSIYENALTICERIAINGGAGSDVALFLNHENYSNLCKELSAKVMYMGGGKTADVGFEGVKFHTSLGVVQAIPDAFCPANRAYVLKKSTWRLYHLEGFPHIVQDDGLMALRQASSDGVEIRMRYWAQPVCLAPAYNGVFSI